MAQCTAPLCHFCLVGRFRLAALRYSYGTDAQLSTILVRWMTGSLASDSFRLFWDSLGRRDSLVYVNPGAHVSYGYDRDGTLRMVRSRHPGNSSQTDQLENQLRYSSVTPDGLPLTVTSSSGGNNSSDSACTGGLSQTNISNFTYDARHQVQADNSVIYKYDASGNRVARRWLSNGVLRDSLMYKPLSNQLDSTRSDGNGGTQVRRSYTYDQNGWLLHEQPENPHQYADRGYFYNAVGEMTGHRVFVDGWYWVGYTNSCHYDALGRRIMACESGGWLGFDGDNVIRNKGTPAYPLWRYAHGPSLDDPLVGVYQWALGSFEKYYYLTDGGGRQLAFTNAQGDTTSTSQANYNQWGGAQAGAIQSSHSFENSRAESPSAPQLSFYRNRYYDQQTGRWTQEDPIGPAGGVNLYGYVGNNPVAYSDPFGLRVCFQGQGYHRLADSTASATGTTFDLDKNNCATNVRAAGDGWTDVSGGFAELAKDENFTVNMIYGGGGSRNDAGRVIIDQGQIGNPYGTQFVGRGRCRTSPGANWDEPSIIAHEVGHAYGTYRSYSGSQNTRTAIDWENQIHAARGRPLRHQWCHR